MVENKKPLKELFSLLIIITVMIVGLFLTSGVTNAIENEAKDAREACTALSNKEQCYAKVFAGITKKSDMARAFEVLRRLQEMDPEARGCHFISHSISMAETEKDPSRWKEIMNNAPQDCSYGAVHGPLEYYASTFPDGKLPKNEIGSLCNNPDINNCSHGLGHVLLIVNENNIDESAEDCETLPHDEMARFECLTGVFMERSTAINLVAHGLAKKEALNWSVMLPETEALCREQSGTRAIACWKETVHVALVALRYDPQKIIDFCESSNDKTTARECIDHSLGVQAAQYDFDLSRASIICDARAKAPDFKARCYPHLVSSVLSTIPQELPGAKKFCSSLEREYQDSCFFIIKNFENRKPGTIKTLD